MKELVNWTRGRAKTSHNLFLRNPNADNWRAATRDMLVFQQAEYLSRSMRCAVEREQLLLTLQAADQREWPGLICLASGAGEELESAGA